MNSANTDFGHRAAPTWFALRGIPGHDAALRRTNYLYLAAMFAMAGAFGTSTAVFYAGSAIWAVISLGFFRFGIDARPLAKALAAVMAVYFLAALLLGFIHWGSREDMFEILQRLPFIFAFAVLARIGLSSGEELVESMENGAFAGAIVAAAFAMAQLAGGTVRPYAYAGNANVFSLANTVLFMICVLAARRRGGNPGLVFGGGALAAFFNVVAGGSRPMWLAILPIVGVVAMFLPAPPVERPRSRKVIAAVIVLALGLASAGWSSLSARIATTAQDAGVFVHHNDASSPLGSRLVLWQCGLEIAAEYPLSGAGIGKAQSLMRECTWRMANRELAYSHFHNMLIDAVTKGGMLQALAALLTLLFPVWALFRWSRPETDVGRKLSAYSKALAIGTAIVFGLSGSTGIFLGHDVHDALYLFILILAFQIASAGNRRAASWQ